jgi:hypothetical protein
METTKLHKFERAGLGKAPFKFTGMDRMVFQACPGAPLQPGGTCHYCSQSITFAYWLRSADGKAFYVGSDCIRKHGDAGLVKSIAPIEKAMKNEREIARIEAAKQLLRSNELSARLKARPHSNPWFASQGRTEFDELEWLFTHAGRAGQLRAARAVEKERS